MARESASQQARVSIFRPSSESASHSVGRTRWVRSWAFLRVAGVGGHFGAEKSGHARQEREDEAVDDVDSLIGLPCWGQSLQSIAMCEDEDPRRDSALAMRTRGDSEHSGHRGDSKLGRSGPDHPIDSTGVASAVVPTSCAPDQGRVVDELAIRDKALKPIGLDPLRTKFALETAINNGSIV